MYETISVIIPARTDSEDLPVLGSLKRVEYPKDKLEIILAIGIHPPGQRNKAAETAKGDILYFFNSDARLDAGIFDKALEIFNKDGNIAGVGGPDLTPQDNNYMQHLFGYAMGSYFAHWKMRARYSRIGTERFTDEKELILSNMAIRRDIYLKARGFNSNLYPNEENELVNRISKMGYKFIYSPDIKIYRDRRKTLFEFAKQFYRYGKGRMSQISMERELKNLFFLMPLFLLVYFLILPFIKNSRFVFIPLFVYAIFAIIDAARSSFKNKKNLLFSLPALYVIMHIFYSLGMLKQLLRNPWRNKIGSSKVSVFIKRIDI